MKSLNVIWVHGVRVVVSKLRSRNFSFVALGPLEFLFPFYCLNTPDIARLLRSQIIVSRQI